MSEPSLKAPFPWYGGKARSASLIWERLGRVNSYVEPFAGSLAILLGRPTPFDGTETVNDADGFVCNAWRAIRSDPDAVADYADWPVSECDLHARHVWLVERRETLTIRLEGDPDYFDAKIAGWWLWGIACWIGSGWCSGKGPWHSVKMPDGSRQLVHLGNAGRGVNRQRDDHREALLAYMRSLSARLRHVRVCCGDWTRVTGPTPMFSSGCDSPNYRAGVVLDPPYAHIADRKDGLYSVDSLTVAHAVREWAIDHGDNPRYRIVLCGYDGEHAMPERWMVVEGKAGRGHGYGGQKKEGYANAGRERLWFSPHCVKPNTDRLIQTFLFTETS